MFFNNAFALLLRTQPSSLLKSGFRRTFAGEWSHFQVMILYSSIQTMDWVTTSRLFIHMSIDYFVHLLQTHGKSFTRMFPSLAMKIDSKSIWMDANCARLKETFFNWPINLWP